jgi:hypothetical protein
VNELELPTEESQIQNIFAIAVIRLFESVSSSIQGVPEMGTFLSENFGVIKLSAVMQKSYSLQRL